MTFFWRSLIIVFAIMVIYLIFPILIVPSKLPAIQDASQDETVSIFQLEGERVLTLKEQYQELKLRHQEGIRLIKERLQ